MSIFGLLFPISCKCKYLSQNNTLMWLKKRSFVIENLIIKKMKQFTDKTVLLCIALLMAISGYSKNLNVQ